MMDISAIYTRWLLSREHSHGNHPGPRLNRRLAPSRHNCKRYLNEFGGASGFDYHLMAANIAIVDSSIIFRLTKNSALVRPLTSASRLCLALSRRECLDRKTSSDSINRMGNPFHHQWRWSPEIKWKENNFCVYRKTIAMAEPEFRRKSISDGKFVFFFALAFVRVWDQRPGSGQVHC